MKNSLSVMELLFPEANRSNRFYAIVALAADSPTERLDVLMGKKSIRCSNGSLTIDLTKMYEDDVEAIVSATMLAHPGEIPVFLMNLQKLPQENQSRPFLHGCILGVLKAATELTNVAEFAPLGRAAVFDTLIDFMWRWGEDNAFVGNHAAAVSNLVASVVKSSLGETAEFRSFLAEISHRSGEEGRYPSDLAEQVSGEFLHKVLTRVGPRAGGSLANALKDMDTFCA